jgi:hypothetical protein
MIPLTPPPQVTDKTRQFATDCRYLDKVLPQVIASQISLRI